MQLIEALVAQAALRHAQGDMGRYLNDVFALAHHPPAPVNRAIDVQLAEARAAAAGRGWHPDQMRRVVAKNLTSRHGRLLDARFADWLADWLATERTDRRLAIAAGIDVLSWLQRLPPLAAAAPGRTAEADSRHLARIRALLAKAESTTFPEEADALTAKAQELMTRYAIDQAMLATTGVAPANAPAARRLVIDDPYAGPKSLLVSEIALANRCRSVWSKAFGFSTIFGFEHDLDAVELLFTSLLVQANPGMKARGSRAYRQSFMVAFADRIGTRLREAASATVAHATTQHGSALLPVLQANAEAVESACRAAFPHLRSQRYSAHDYAGRAAGTTAADLANLSTRGEMSA